MEGFVIVALVGVALLVAELLLPTGGVLAALGVIGLILGGVLALGSNAGDAEWIGPALITIGILCGLSSWLISRKVLAAHRDEPVRTGREEMVGSTAEVRASLDPDGQVFIGGALWRARLADGVSGAARPGDRVVVEAIDGLTLVVKPAATAATTEQGAS